MPVDGDLTIGAPGRPEVDVEPGAVDDELEHELYDDELTPAPLITEAQVRDLLDGAGRAFSVPPLDCGVPRLWRFSVDELDGLTPPLTRVINKRPPLARAVAKGDEVFVLLQLAGYLGRRGDLVRAARREARIEEGTIVDDDEHREARGAVVGSVGTNGAMARGSADFDPYGGRGRPADS